MLRRASVALGTIVLPASAALFLAGPLALITVFGTEYRANASGALRVLSLTAPFVAIYAMVITVLRIARQTTTLVLLHVLYASMITVLALRWARLGLTGIAEAWLVGHAMTACLGVVAAVIHRRIAGPVTRPDQALN